MLLLVVVLEPFDQLPSTLVLFFFLHCYLMSRSVEGERERRTHRVFLTAVAAKPEYRDPIVLLTGSRQRTAEELDRDRDCNRLGGGFRNYGGDRPNRSSGGGDDSSNSRWGSSRVSNE
ncbi:hypothetical protein PIB30_023649 [Stylosanthes scabra]|uniref:Uncharacterized protein n=1 Tax=Stylosanthes scabra TaxID=79078 RepID=A0ABU6R9Q7_9FABA|nr:hypothetical protein [Stylosanthes scabra]